MEYFLKDKEGLQTPLGWVRGCLSMWQPRQPYAFSGLVRSARAILPNLEQTGVKAPLAPNSSRSFTGTLLSWVWS
jgi:hypothetical protein